MNFFGTIYCWFEDMFGLDLANYLWGEYWQGIPPEQGIAAPTINFMNIGIAMLAISAVVALIYYYAINHPRWNNWWVWLIVMVVNFLINFLVGWQWTLYDYNQDLMQMWDAKNEELVKLAISDGNMALFGVANGIISCIAFFISSMVMKWGSRNCSNSPF